MQSHSFTITTQKRILRDHIHQLLTKPKKCFLLVKVYQFLQLGFRTSL